MQDKAKELLGKVLEWWNKFTSRQRTIIIGMTAVVIFTFVILIYIFSKPQYTLLKTCEDTADAAELAEILDGASIKYDVSTDGLSIKVLNSQLSGANLAIGAAGYMPEEYTPQSAISSSISTTEADKQRQYVYYLEKKLERDFQNYASVKKARVTLHLPEQTGTLIATKEEAYAYIQLELEDTMTEDQAATIARAVSTALGNSSTANITIADTNKNLLFSGEEDYSITGIASNFLQLRAQAETMVAADVKKVLVGTRQYDNVEVVSSLDIDFANYEKTIHGFSAPDGREEGMLTSEEIHQSDSTNGTGNLVGTDANDESNKTTILSPDNSSSESSESNILRNYAPDETITNTNIPPGTIDYAKSSTAVTALSYQEIKEEDAKKQGLLDGVTWEEYKAANGAMKKLEVDEELISVVSKATRIPEDNITIMAFQETIFTDKAGVEVNMTDVLSIVLIVVILALLGFVVLKSMIAKKEVETEEELSVENLLQSTPDTDLEDIEIESKSETRKMIEKFVDDNPEAAASLLRNWLNEDWG